ADISERQKAMLDFALKVSREAETVAESDYLRLNGFGFDDEDIWDIGTISAFFGLSNRIVNMTSMRTNGEFYLMGRVPREK
ncbi:MAG: alkylhydroperoxidase, partial [Gammaproteobacteria bacterium]|nr:alkylhydroperoxidase [Gammaproteobacteria bacterium]